MQVLYSDPGLEERLSEACEEAFGAPVTLNRVAGGRLYLHIGRPASQGSLPPSRQYLEEIGALPLLEEQGDGMRSFIGILLALVAAHYPIVLVDEPEAFLHPPQARLLARKMSQFLPQGTQVVVATHSSDVLMGLLDIPERPVSIARLERRGAVNPTAVLPSDRLRPLWQDPLLRFSNILNAPFHAGVIVCEADSDCRLYGALLDEATGGAHDLLLVPAGGKQRFQTIIDALMPLGIPLRIVADLDLLREREQLRRILAALGMPSNDDLDRDWQVLHSAIRGLAGNPTLGEVKERLGQRLSEAPESDGAPLSTETAELLRREVRITDAWTSLKMNGVGGVPQGAPSESARRLISRLEGAGLFLVEVGELERWFPQVPGHGPGWVSEVIERRLHEDHTSQAAAFVRRIKDSFEPGSSMQHPDD